MWNEAPGKESRRKVDADEVRTEIVLYYDSTHGHRYMTEDKKLAVKYELFPNRPAFLRARM